MSSDVHEDDLLALYAMGELPESAMAEVRHRLATGTLDPTELKAWEELVGALADASVESAPAVPSFDAIRQTTRRLGALEVYADQVARLVDADLRRARGLLRLLSDPSAWLHMYPGCRLLHVRPGPAIARPGLDVGFVSLDPGTPFPEHRHLGDEAVLVLQGTLLDLSSGAAHGPGARVEMIEGSVHAVQAGPDERLVYLVVAGGIEIAGTTIPEPPEEWIW